MTAAKTFDVDAIKTANPPGRVFDLLKIDYKRSGSKLKALACPGCGKSKRMDYDLAKDAFNCFTCDIGGHDVISLVMQVLNMTFQDACQYLGGDRSLTPAEKEAAEALQKERRERQRAAERQRLGRKKARMKELLDVCVPARGTVVETYLRGRGLSVILDYWGDRWPADLRFAPSIAAGAGDGKDWQQVGLFPAMVAIGRDGRNKLTLLHRTFLAAGGEGQVVKASPDLPSGFEPSDWNAKQMLGELGRTQRGVYLGGIADETGRVPDLSITAEGIESTLAVACALIPGHYYAALSLGRLTGRADDPSAGWLPPKGQSVLIIGDNDLSGVPRIPDGIERATAEFDRALCRLTEAGFQAALVLPPAGLDPNDWLLTAPETLPAVSGGETSTAKAMEAA